MIILILTAAGLLVLFWLYALLQLMSAGTLRRVWLITTSMMVGLAAGFLLFEVEYQPSSMYRVIGIPLPLAVFHLEDGVWVDYVYDPIQTYLMAGLNILLIASAILLPALVYNWVAQRRE